MSKENLNDYGVVIPARLIPHVAGALSAMAEMSEHGIEQQVPEDMRDMARRVVLKPLTEAHDILVDKDKWIPYDEAQGCRKSADVVRLAVDNAREQSKKEDGDDLSPDE